jgi:transcription elongation factor GreA
MATTPMTKKGADALLEELKNLKQVQRPRVVAAIAEAREHGDLKENAEYHAAREQQGFIEGRVQDIEGKLGNAQVIDVANLPKTGKILFGTTVTIVNMDSEEEVRYQIVGDDEANVKNNKISVNSPIARALIGKMEGDDVVVKAPSGEIDYEISKVEYL